MNRSVSLGSLVVVILAGIAAGQVPGFEVVRITDDEFWDTDARINNCGEVVFSKEINFDYLQQEIFLYDNGKVVQITDNDVQDRLPDINDAGTIVWSYNQSDLDNREIRMLADGIVTSIGLGSSSTINNLGHVAWKWFRNTGCNAPSAIFFFDGSDVMEIIDDGFSHQGAEINDFDEIVWTQYDFCSDPWESEILMYSGGSISQLTNGQNSPQIPFINNLAQVGWHSRNAQLDRVVELWEDGITTVFANPGAGPKLNNEGDIAFGRSDTQSAWLFHKGVFWEIRDEIAVTGAQDINDSGEVLISLWYGFPHSDFALLRRIRTGDTEFDGDIDLNDFAVSIACLTGPFDTNRLCLCRFLDIDHDRDVDLADFALFQSNFGQVFGVSADPGTHIQLTIGN